MRPSHPMAGTSYTSSAISTSLDSGSGRSPRPAACRLQRRSQDNTEGLASRPMARPSCTCSLSERLQHRRRCFASRCSAARRASSSRTSTHRRHSHPMAKRMAFIRRVGQPGTGHPARKRRWHAAETALASRTASRHLSSDRHRVVSRRTSHRGIRSADGGPRANARIVLVDAETGRRTGVQQPRASIRDGPAHVARSMAAPLLFDAIESTAGAGTGTVSSGRWRTRAGTVRRITPDVAQLSRASSASVRRSDQLVAVQRRGARGVLGGARRRCFARARPIFSTRQRHAKASRGIDWTPDGRIVYSSITQKQLGLRGSRTATAARRNS